MKKAKPNAHPQLSYDALLIHGVMLVCVVGTAIAWSLLPPYGKEQDAAVGTGLSAALVLGLWSLVLAVRAWRKKEPSRWPVVVVGLFVLEVLSCGMAFLLSARPFYILGDWVRFLGLPVLIPVFLLASLIAAPIAFWRTRRAERKESAKGGAPWSSSRRWKRRLAWYCPVAAMVFAILLPIPLFVFCAYGVHPNFPRNPVREPEWHVWVTEHTPETVGNAAAWLLSCSEQPWSVQSYAVVLRSGRVSSARLLSEVDSQVQDVAYSAMGGLQSCHKEELLRIARMVGQGSKTLRCDGYERCMGYFIRELADPAEKDRYLDPTQHPWPSLAFLDGLLGFLGHRQNEAYASKLTQYCDGKAPDREAALKRLAHFAWQGGEIEPLWAKYLADKDPERRKQAIASIPFIRDPNQALNVLATALESEDETLRRDLARNIQDILIMGYGWADQKVLAHLVKALLPFLDFPDINVIQDSAWVLSRLIKAPQLENCVRETANWTAGATHDAKSPPALTPEARKLLDDIRAAARKWLGE